MISFDDQVFSFIVQYKTDHDGISPSMMEMADYFGASVGHISNTLDILEEDGRIVRALSNNKRVRCITVPGGMWSYEQDRQDSQVEAES